jgi:hypothetical protein
MERYAMNNPVSVNVRFLSDETYIEVTVVECPACFALVREQRLDEHREVLHDN